MGHFRVTLESGEAADIRFGKIIKKQFSPFAINKLFRRRQGVREVRIGYIVHLVDAHGKTQEFRLLRNQEGQWLDGGVPGFNVSCGDELCVSVRNAIEKYEQQNQVK